MFSSDWLPYICSCLENHPHLSYCRFYCETIKRNLLKLMFFMEGRFLVPNCYLVTKSCLDSFETPWTTAHQAPLSMGFPRQQYWSGLSFPSPRDLSNPRIEPTSLALAGRFFTTQPPGMPPLVPNQFSSVTQSCPTLCDPMDCSMLGFQIGFNNQKRQRKISNPTKVVRS